MATKIIGKVSATEKSPSTVDDFYFWTNKKTILSPFDIVKVHHVKNEKGEDSITYGVVEEISHITDATSHITSYLSSDFGEVEDKYISFIWDGENGNELLVEMKLEVQPDSSTVIRISEGKMKNDEAGIRWLIGNTEGWANFLACLKAYLEYGINLRKGAFNFMKDNK